MEDVKHDKNLDSMDSEDDDIFIPKDVNLSEDTKRKLKELKEKLSVLLKSNLLKQYKE